MAYRGAKCKIDECLITLKVYASDDAIDNFTSMWLKEMLNEAVAKIPPMVQSTYDIDRTAKLISTILEDDMFGNLNVPYYEVELLRSDGTFYGHMNVNDPVEALAPAA